MDIGTCLHFYVLATLSSTYFSPFGRGLHSRVWASTRKLGCAFADAHSGGAGKLVPLLCPDWYAAGLMTGSGWFDSAHGLQVYHFYPFTPLALRLGVVFYFLDVMPMFCPYPTTCIYDRYRVAGVHSCSTPVCPFRMQAKTMLEQEIALLEGIRHKTEGQEEAIRRLRSKYKAEFGGDAMSKNRGGGHAPPD